MDNITILIVDDEPINLKLVAESLNDRYNILVVRSGIEALELLKNHHVDLILLDISMPEMDGFEVAKELKNNLKTAHIPFIFLTADNAQETIVKAFETGAVDYIIKPFQPQELNVRVDNRIQTNHLQRQLKRALKKNTHLLEVVDQYVSFVKVDPMGIVQEISSNFCKQLGCLKESMIGQNINVLKSGNMTDNIYKKLWNTIKSGQTFSHDMHDRNFSGGTNWFHVTISPDYDEKNNHMGYIAFYENVDDKVKYKIDSQTDSLTGLMNRTKIDEVLLNEIKRVKRYDYPFSIILVDIDHFKEVNDKFGHQAGDSVLKEFAKLLSENIRESDFLGRWGGEEFLILCPHSNADGALVFAESLRKKIEQFHFEFVGHKTASFGVVEYAENNTQEMLFKLVDEALYDAKERGRNRVVLSNS
ncbi:MAG: diguanylate cyclase [Sulfuricurvum sp.]|nr:diguanylate cyclase [Sulfuricurvum sp.]